MRYLILILLLMPLAYGQSIGITPRVNEIEVFTNEPVVTDFRLSQAAGYDERITIEPEQDYDWVDISETEFVLEPGVRKIVELSIHTEQNGVYEVVYKICASGNEPGTLSVVACTDHKLIVTSVTNPTTIVVATSVTAGSIFLISGLGFFMWRRRNMRKRMLRRINRPGNKL